MPPDEISDAPWLGMTAATVGLRRWPDRVCAERWQHLFGVPPEGIFVLTDPQVAESHGQLRSLALLRALGVSRFTFAAGWRGLHLAPFEWFHVGNETESDAIRGRFPVCQIVSQAIEDASTGDACYKLWLAHERSDPCALLVYVFDDAAFARAQGQQVRSFVDEHSVSRVFDYGALADRFGDQAFGPALEPVSRNLLWRGLQRFLLPGTSTPRLRNLVDFEHHRADSPIWDLYAHLCNRAGPLAETEELRATLRAWIDRDVTNAVDRIVECLRRVNFDRFELARLRAAREVA